MIIRQNSIILLVVIFVYMLTVASLLFALWFAGIVFSVTLGGFIHLLLIVAIVMAMVRIIEGEHPLAT